jgi:2-dehydro-3-deoxyphosphogluconate aldolase / (4S)-4-hydroxy-2-oxoglutarate aldolase
VTALPRGVVAVIRTHSTAEALTLARGYLRAGVPGVEVTLTVPDAAAVIRAVAGSADGRVGAGTVLDPARVDEVVASGAAYVVAPDTNPAVLARAAALGVPAVPGTLTPTEMTAAVRQGAAGVKVFPVSGVGGAAYVRAVLEPLPFLRVVASGGITVEEVPAYLDAGAWAVCLGKELVDRAALAAGDVDGVAEKAAAVLARAGVAGATVH